MNYIVLDLEATCWKSGNKYKNEIIEIGALMLNENKEIISEFSTFVKPLKFPVLSDFCTELTSIEQSDVENAPMFAEAIADFQDWINWNNNEYVLCSWGFYDKNQFISDCKLFGLSTDWVNPHISLKHQYAEINNLRRAIGMKGALEREKIALEGFHHRGIDDARNIAKIFIAYFEDWQF